MLLAQSLVLGKPLFKECASLNERSKQALLSMQPEAFIAAMDDSAAFYTNSQSYPALGLSEELLDRLGRVNRIPAFVCNFFGEGPVDGMHTADVSRRVAKCIGEAATLVVSEDQTVWFKSLVKFVRSHAAE